ncbi:hypothetical protein PMI37_05122, partial [Pseudomonas sp. GM80]
MTMRYTPRKIFFTTPVGAAA